MPLLPRAVRLPDDFRLPARNAALAAITTALVSLAVPDQFRSTARILPSNARGASSLSNLMTAAAAFGMSLPGSDGSEGSYEDILKSQWMRERLLGTTFRYRTRSWKLASWKERESTLAQFIDARNVDRALEELDDMFRVTKDLKTKLVTLTVETPSPDLSQQVARKALAYLEEFLLTKGQQSGSGKAAFTAKALAEAKEDERKAEAAFKQFLEANRFFALSVDPQTRLMGARLEADLRLKGQMTVMHTLSHEQAVLEEKNDVPTLNILDAGNLPHEKSRPSRTVWTLLSALLAGAATWSWIRRHWLLTTLVGPASSAP